MTMQADARNTGTGPSTGVQPLTDTEIARLQTLLDAIPQPFEPLDITMLDGFLCGVLLQPERIAPRRWLPLVTDAEGRALPASVGFEPLHALVLRRHAELDAAIGRRAWFDPWVVALRGAAVDDTSDETSDDADASDPAAVYPWVAGFAAAMAAFPAVIDDASPEVTEPMALLLRHLDPDDLDDADDLLAEIETLEPLADLSAAVEDLVRATLLLADVTRPLQATAPSRPPARRAPTPRGAGTRPAARSSPPPSAPIATQKSARPPGRSPGGQRAIGPTRPAKTPKAR